MSNGRLIDTCAALPQTHMYMESDYILFVLESGALTHTCGKRFLLHFVHVIHVINQVMNG
jgi:hypothetical protein